MEDNHEKQKQQSQQIILHDKQLFSNDKSFTLNIAKIEENGEDADPIAIFTDGKAVMFVFDGLGGAGSRKITLDGKTKTSAYFASRKVSEITYNYFTEIIEKRALINEKSIKLFNSRLKDELNRIVESLPSEKSKLKSNLIKKLPTTISGVVLKENKNNLFDCVSIWAGDSRSYIITPSKGLKQLTEDDLRQKGDAFENLANDSKMSNFINADDDFKINSRYFEVHEPSIIFCSTDGAYDYLPTPMHFEYLILNSINKSNSLNDLKNKLIEKFKEIPVGDDVSMAFIYVGWNSYEEMKACYIDRFKFLHKQYINVLLEKEKNLKELQDKIKSLQSEITNLKSSSWAIYKKDYLDLPYNQHQQ